MPTSESMDLSPQFTPAAGARRDLSRRSLIRAGIGLAGAGVLFGAGPAGPAQAGLNKLATANATKVARITNVRETNRFSAPYTDLCIPVRRRDGSLLLIGGDTYDSRGLGASNDWRAPVGLTSSRIVDNGRILIDGAITDRPNHAMALVIQDHANDNTSLPTDVFRVGDTLYMHIVRGPLGRAQTTEFYRSTNNGASWEFLRWWTGDEYGGQFQQKTYAADTDDAYVYVMSTVFNRGILSGLLLFRLLKSDLNKTQADADRSGFGQRFAYQGWGFANGRWAWGNLPTSIIEVRHWGEICFRAMGGKYVLSWFQRNPGRVELEDCRAMVFPLPTSNLFQTTEQTMVYHSMSNPASGGKMDHWQEFPYGPFIVPGSTFDKFDFMVSNWDNTKPASESNYGVTQWRTKLNPNI